MVKYVLPTTFVLTLEAKKLYKTVSQTETISNSRWKKGKLLGPCMQFSNLCFRRIFLSMTAIIIKVIGLKERRFTFLNSEKIDRGTYSN